MAYNSGSYGGDLVAGLTAAIELLTELPEAVHRLSGAELDSVLPVVDRLAAVSAAGRFTIAAEASSRGEVAASQSGSLAQWVHERCSSLDARAAGQVAKAVRELGAPPLSEARAAVAEGRLSVHAGCVAASEWRQLKPLVEPAAASAVLAGLVTIGEVEGAAGIRALRSALLARYGLGERLQELEDKHAGLTELSCGRDIGGGITEYRMRLNPEARAVVEAAINVLAAPGPSSDGASDSRTTEQRRGDALVEVCRRAVAAGAATQAGVKATVIVTIGLDDLHRRTRPGTLVGGVDAGTLLGPETVRRMTCDGAVIPVVVGADGHILHFGRTERWFTAAQIRALWLRDRHCTFPGCSVPATWCDAHHVWHWCDGGPTDLENGALLCGRHHTVVHRDRLMATVSAQGVAWDRTPGSYDRALARGPTVEPAA